MLLSTATRLLITTTMRTNVWRIRFILITLVCCLVDLTTPILLNINLQPKHLVSAELIGHTFRGNHSQSDHFKLLERHNGHLLVGARNAVYNLSMETLAVHQKLDWPSSGYDVENCLIKGKDQEECNNYIRVLVMNPETGKTLVCGTNSFRPLCRQYGYLEDGHYQMHREFNGFAISPYDPKTNSTTLYLPGSDEIFTGTHSDFAATDPLIYRKSLSGLSVELRTPRHDLKLLNDPHFVFSFEDGEHVYFLFREVHECNNCEKKIASRIARVCKRDAGSASHPDEWTSFAKVQLNCSIPGEIPFHIDMLHAATPKIRGFYGGKAAELIYTVFTTPYQGVQISAVCAFRMDDIRQAFTKGAKSAMWKQGSGFKDGAPTMLGSCAENSKLLSDKAVNWIKKNPLMEEAVQNFFDQPILIENNFRSVFTQIAVLPQIQAIDGHLYDLVFIGTDDGRVLKVVNSAVDKGARISVRSQMVESVQVFSARQPVENLLVYTFTKHNGESSASADTATMSPSLARLVVVSRDEVKSLPLQYCGNMSTCTACVRLQDPLCSWDLRERRCVGSLDGWFGADYYAQDVTTGESPLCPGGEVDKSFYTINDLYPLRAMSEPGIYSAESMAIGIVLTIAVASVIGFIIGYRLAWMKAESANSSCASSSFYESATLRSKLASHCDATQPLTNNIERYSTLALSKHNEVPNLVEGKNEKNANAFVLNNGTLPKDYKTRKVYL